MSPRTALQDYPPIREHGLIGDCHTAALVGPGGSVDWWCPDRFDRPSVFTRLLDAERGGAFRIAPRDAHESEARYEPHTNILRSTFTTAAGRVAVFDLMPVKGNGDLMDDGSHLLRLVKCERGRAEVDVTFRPRFGYAAHAATFDVTAAGAVARPPSSAGDGVRPLALATRLPLAERGDALTGTLRLDVGESHAFIVKTVDGGGTPRPVGATEGLARLRTTRLYWEEWAAKSVYEGPYREHVRRSALALKALMHRPTGALVAAPTTSLPEEVGGVRNWDYRYAWIRDTAFAVTAFHQAGHLEDSGALAHWVGDRLADDPVEDVRIMYRVDGKTDLDEEELDHVHGYKGSRPVRVGNEAVHQWQLDVFGEAVDCLHLARALGTHEEDERWGVIRRVVDYVARSWREPDNGIWEMRGEPRHFVVSKVLAWVALDRGVSAIEDFDLEGPLDEWRVTRDAIHADVCARGHDPERNAFVQAYGWRNMDAANLLIPILGFLPATDDRVRGTVRAIREDLVDGCLVHRYRPGEARDGLPGEEGAFNVCTFWMAEVLAQMGKLEDAKDLMERMLARGGTLGLYAEEMDPRTGAHLGNHPQGLTHIGLVNAAAAISRAEALQGEPSLHRHLAHLRQGM